MRAISFLAFICLLFIAESAKSQAAAYPFPQNRTYTYGYMQTYESAAAAGTRAQTWYNQWKTTFYTEDCGGGKARIRNGAGSGTTFSEGQGYGMLLAAYAGDKAAFDKLWAFYKANENGNGLMNWMVTCGGTTSANGATDGDLDAAMALLIAECQWPSATSPYDYGAEATTLITSIRNKEMYGTCSGLNVTRPGDAFNIAGACNCINISYFAPGYYRAFADHVPAQAAFWDKAADDCYTIINSNMNANTGLVSAWTRADGSIPNNSGSAPDYCGYSATGGAGPDAYQYDACRTPWRIAVDYLWWGTPAADTWLTKVTNWANATGSVGSATGGGGPGNIRANYDRATGSPAGSERNSAFVGAFAVGTMANSQSLTNSWYQSWVTRSSISGYSAADKLDDAPYYQNSLGTMYLFLASGNFWYPCSSVPPSPITVSVTSPVNGAYIGECDGPVTINATATTTSGSISKVEFYVDGTKIGEDLSSPYSYTWSNYTTGSHTINAKAYTATDNNTSSNVGVTVVPGIYQTSTAPTIDGTIDAAWSSANSLLAGNVIGGTVSSGTDLTGDFKVMWDNSKLYILADITDDARYNESANGYDDDGIEIYIDMGNSNAASYGANDFRYEFDWNSTTVIENEHSATTGVSFSQANRTGGYVMEISIPWSALGGAPATGDLVGMDFHVNDDDNGGTRDGKKAWSSTTDDVWTNPALMGTLKFGTTNCTGCTSPDLGPDVSICGSSSIILNSQITTGSGKTFTWKKNGTTVAGPNTTATTYTATTAGTYEVTVDDNGCIRTDEITITGTLPTPVISPSGPLNLCSPATYDFTVTNAASFPSGVTWQWSKGGSSLTGETTSSLSNVRIAGVYRITASTTGCSSTYDEETVTSSLPTPVDGCRASSGTVNLSITNPGLNGTNYNWYSAATGGSPLTGGTGTTSFTTPSISSTTTYYVQDMSAVNTNIGPTAKFGTDDNWGCTDAHMTVFTASANFTLKSVKVPHIWYNSNPQSFDIEILNSSNTVVATFTTDANTTHPTSGTSLATFTFNGGAGVLINQASWGSNLKMRIKASSCVGGATPVFNPGVNPSYGSYTSSVVNITGAINNGTANTTDYMFFYDWSISTGTSCDRLPVIAKIGSCSSLPVGFTNFAGEAMEGYTQLNWATSFEINNDRFEIEKSRDGENFISIGKISASGDKSGASVYSFADYEAHTGVCYYRIAQYDVDGTVTYSNVISIQREEVGFIQAVPNPFGSTSELVVVSNQGTDVQLRIMDLSGVERFSSEGHAVNEKITIGADLPKGVYIVQATVNNKIYTTRIVKF